MFNMFIRSPTQLQFVFGTFIKGLKYRQKGKCIYIKGFISSVNHVCNLWLFFSVCVLQVSVICVRVPATCGSTEVSTDLPVRGKTEQALNL